MQERRSGEQYWDQSMSHGGVTWSQSGLRVLTLSTRGPYSKAILGRNGHKIWSRMKPASGAIRGHRVVRKFIHSFIPQIFIECLPSPGTLGADILVK